MDAYKLDACKIDECMIEACIVEASVKVTGLQEIDEALSKVVIAHT